MLIPTVKVGPTLIWLDPEADRTGVPLYHALEHGSLTEQCIGCGADVGDATLTGNRVKCECGEVYEVVDRRVD